jgi:arsenical pump membrane protein
VAGTATALLVSFEKREAPWPLLRGVSWGVLFLVAGLFVLVEELNLTGLAAELGSLLKWLASQSAKTTAWVSGPVLAFASNLVNNLPAALIAESAATPANPPPVGDGGAADWRGSLA